ncbi:MAG: MarR family transcriptional regulator [Patescibacteria group bacterium]
MEGFHLMQQKMLAKHKPMASIDQVTFSQWRVLDVIDEHDYVTIKDIHTALNITSSAATQLVNELEKKKHVAREAHPDDKRATAITLTRNTKKFIQKFKDQHVQGFRKLFEALDDTEFEQYIHLHKKIIKNIINKK